MVKKQEQLDKENRGGLIESRPYPMFPLERNRLLKLVDTILKFGGSSSRQDLKNTSELKSVASYLGQLIASAKQYGLIKRVGLALQLDEFGEQYGSAKNGDDKKLVIMKTLLAVPCYAKLVKEKDFPTGRVLFLGILKLALEKYGVDKEDSAAVANSFIKTLREWNIEFAELKMLETGGAEPLKIDTMVSQESISLIKDQNIPKAVWLVEYLRHTKKDFSKKELEQILDVLAKSAAALPELSKKVGSAKDFLGEDPKVVMSFIHSKFEEALIADLNLKDLENTINGNLENNQKDVKSKHSDIEEVDLH